LRSQLLGTETVQALRARGVTSRICGLSANDKGAEFLAAGADAFCIKPFPCGEKAMKKELCRVLFSESARASQD
jgi:DNA-binding response OmpR family regulator